MIDAHGHALDRELLERNVGIGFLVLVAGSKNISVLIIVIGKLFQIIQSFVQRNDEFPWLSVVLLSYDHIVTGMNTGVDHRVSLGDEGEELAPADYALRQADTR